MSSNGIGFMPHFEDVTVNNVSNNKEVKSNPFNHEMVNKGGTRAGQRAPMVMKVGRPYSNKGKEIIFHPHNTAPSSSLSARRGIFFFKKLSA